MPFSPSRRVRLVAAVTTTVLLVAPGSLAANTPAAVTIKDHQFKPPALTVPSGATVTFVNKDGDAHTVQAFDRSWASAGLDTGDHYSRVFTKPGVYRYFCSLHPYMTGTITVTPAKPSRPGGQP